MSMSRGSVKELSQVAGLVKKQQLLLAKKLRKFRCGSSIRLPNRAFSFFKN